VIQEAFNNIVKHANAKNVKIDLLLKGGEINLVIEDDGVGFDAETFFEDISVDKFGLRGMRERVDLLNGKFLLESKAKNGTKLIVVFSIIEKAQR
ncbi:MAG: ATP-binding protein, partial [Candidatus Omnitrophica bacterium]|nr:ATP-binding protein [Candidatus Omnitrophota bacterium]